MNVIIFNYLIIIVVGLIVGSFLNVVIWRFDDLKSVLTGRSHCPKCRETLRWYDLIPVLSYIFLWGRCRYCKKEISLQYPLVEAGTALIFAGLFWQFGLSVLFISLSLVSCLLIIIFVYDILKLQIADWLVYVAAGLWLIYLAIGFFILHYPLSTIYYSLFGALALGGFLGLMVWVSKEKWMGAGDIGLGALIGAIASWPLVLVAGFSAFVLGGLLGVILISTKKKEAKDHVPFAPFLILGLFLTIFYGQQILNWYLGGIF